MNPDLNEGLPPFLTPHPGISSGYMLAQVTAVALLNEMRVLAHPASIDNVPDLRRQGRSRVDGDECGLEAAAGRWRTPNTCWRSSCCAAAEGLEYRRPLRAGRGVEKSTLKRVPVAGAADSRTGHCPAISNASAEAIREGRFEVLSHRDPAQAVPWKS